MSAESMGDSIKHWANAFSFSEDLMALESAYHQEHKAQLKEQLQQDKSVVSSSGIASSRAVSQDDVFLESLSEKIATRLSRFLQNPEVLAQYIQREGLEMDNAAMALQIKALTEQLANAQAELDDLQRYQRQNRFQKIFGNLYFKTF